MAPPTLARSLILVVFTCLLGRCHSDPEKLSLPAGIERLNPLVLDLGLLAKEQINLRSTNGFINFTAGRPPSDCLTANRSDNSVKIVFDSGDDHTSCHMFWNWSQRSFYVGVGGGLTKKQFRIQSNNDVGFFIGPNGTLVEHLADTLDECRVPNAENYTIKFSAELGEQNTCSYYLINFKDNVEYVPETSMLVLIKIGSVLVCVVVLSVGLIIYCVCRPTKVIARQVKLSNKPATKSTMEKPAVKTT